MRDRKTELNKSSLIVFSNAGLKTFKCFISILFIFGQELCTSHVVAEDIYPIMICFIFMAVRNTMIAD